MKKKILLLFIITLCFGCTANYNLKINDDLTVEESITGLEPDEYYKSYYNSSKDLVVRNAVILQQDYLDSNNYSFETKKESSSYGAIAYLKYNSLDDYYKRSEVYKQYFENWQIKKDSNIISINLSNKKNPNGTGVDGRYTVNDGTVSINLPFKVLDHNSDKKDGNTYIWNIDSYKGDSIYIKFDSSKKSGFNYSIIYFIIVSLGLISIIAVVTLFLKKNKSASKF